MKCNECKYNTLNEDFGDLECHITGDLMSPDSECECPNRRVLKDKETRLHSTREDAIDALTALRAGLVASRPDIKYIYGTLMDIASEVDSTKLVGLIQYLADFINE